MGCSAGRSGDRRRPRLRCPHLCMLCLRWRRRRRGRSANVSGSAATISPALVERWFPHAREHSVHGATRRRPAWRTMRSAMLRDLLLAHRSTPGDESRWLAAMIARRAMEANHLWEDLGLRDRSELSRLLARHFAPLAVPQHEEYALETLLLPHSVRRRRPRHVFDAGLHVVPRFRSLLRRRERR